MSNPYLFVPIFSWPAAPGGQLFSYFAGGTVFAPTYNAAGAVNTNPVILDANGSAAVRRDPDISYHFVLKDATGASTIWDADGFPADAIFGAATTLSAGPIVDLGSAAAHSALIHGASATITSFGTSANAGTPFYVATFDGVNTLVNSSTLALPGAANITTAAGDAVFAQFTGVGWNVLFYQQGFVSGTATGGGGGGGSIPTDIVLYQAANTGTFSNTTFIQNTHLSTSSLAVGDYEYELLLNVYSNASSNGGIVVELKQNGALLLPLGGASTLIISHVNNTTAVAAAVPSGVSASFATLSFGTPVTIYDVIYIRGTFKVVTAGPLELWYCQNSSSSGGADILAGSMLKVGSATSS